MDVHLDSNPSINPEITQIEQHLNELDFDKRTQAIDAYSRVVAKFQKWMLSLYFNRSHIKKDRENMLTEDELVIIDFEYVYSQIFPSMYFYKIKKLPCVQGFDLISLLVTDFKYLDFAFDDLPIVYQTVFEKIEICMVWYDDRLKLKLKEFCKSNLKLLQLNSELLKLNILPVSLLESEDFSNIVKNSDKIRVFVKKDVMNLETKEKILKRPFPLKEFFEFKNGDINMLFFNLKLLKENQEDINKNNSQDSNNEKSKLIS